MKCIICRQNEVEDYEKVCDACMKLEKELERIEHEEEMEEYG